MDFVYGLLPHLLNGITVGLLFALIALGFMLILSVMQVINFAHGSLFALGAYMALLVSNPQGWLEGEWIAAYRALPVGWRYAIALVVAPVIVGVLGTLIELCLRRTYRKPPLAALMLTFGAALVIEELIRVSWGRGEQVLQVPAAITGGVILGDLIYSKYRFFASLFAAVMILILWLLIERTRYGAIVKAGAHDSEMVQALGVNLRRLRVIVFAFGSGLAGLAGIAMGPLWGVRPHMGIDAVLPAFVIIVLGGVGSFWGAVLSALMVGMVIGLTGAYKTDWSLFSMYLLLIAVVTFRARGLFGRRSVLEH